MECGVWSGRVWRGRWSVECVERKVECGGEGGVWSGGVCGGGRWSAEGMWSGEWWSVEGNVEGMVWWSVEGKVNCVGKVECGGES